MYTDEGKELTCADKTFRSIWLRISYTCTSWYPSPPHTYGICTKNTQRDAVIH
jgi:hypothetical protein